jgi:hypothetical protein
MGSHFIGARLRGGWPVGEVWLMGVVVNFVVGTNGAHARQPRGAGVAESGQGDFLDHVARRWVCLKPLVHTGHMAMP